MASLPPSKIEVPSAVAEICNTLRVHGHGAWVVGGCVRDSLLGLQVNDWDVATSALPEQTKKLFRKVIPTGEKHGTVTVLFGSQSYEVTTLRGEGAYSDGRRPDSVFFVQSIEQDLLRRDFTVNAIAYDPQSNLLIDPFSGMQDLTNRVLRAVGDPRARFNEDGLRVLRAARLSATLEFEIEPETERAISSTFDTFRKVSHERIRDEIRKAMKASRPSVAFQVIRRTGLLNLVIPEMVDQVGCLQNRYHAFDVWDHTMKCVDACEGVVTVRLAALLHDLGKPKTRELSEKTNDYTFFHHEKLGADMADQWLRSYRFSNDERERIVHLVRHHLVCYTTGWTDAAVRRFLRRVGTEYFEDLMSLAVADVKAKGRPVEEELQLLSELRARVAQVIAEGAALTQKDLAVGGKDVMERLGIPPGRTVGIVLEKLTERVLDDPELNDRDALLSLIDEIGMHPDQSPKDNDDKGRS